MLSHRGAHRLDFRVLAAASCPTFTGVRCGFSRRLSMAACHCAQACVDGPAARYGSARIPRRSGFNWSGSSLRHIRMIPARSASKPDAPAAFPPAAGNTAAIGPRASARRQVGIDGQPLHGLGRDLGRGRTRRCAGRAAWRGTSRRAALLRSAAERASSGDGDAHAGRRRRQLGGRRKPHRLRHRVDQLPAEVGVVRAAGSFEHHGELVAAQARDQPCPHGGAWRRATSEQFVPGGVAQACRSPV